MTNAAAFQTIADRVLGDPGVTEGTGFGSSPGLRVDGRIFAMLAADGLVLKLSASRCAELVAAGLGRPFDRGQGRPLKQWIVVNDGARREWFALAREALACARPQATSMTEALPRPSNSGAKAEPTGRIAP